MGRIHKCRAKTRIGRRITAALWLTLLAAGTSANAEPATIAAGVQVVSTALRMMGNSAQVDVSRELIKQNKDLSVELHKRFDAFADGLVTLLVQINKLNERTREEINDGFAKHQRDEVLGHIDTLRERLSVVVEKIERGEVLGDKDWEGLTRAQQLLQEKARVLAQKDDRNLAVLLEALSWEWTVHKVRKDTIAIDAMKQFYIERLTEVLNPIRQESIYARMIRNAETIENEVESTEKTVAALRKFYEAQRPLRSESWYEEVEALYGNRRCAPRPVDVFVTNEQAKAKGERLRKELDGPFDVRMEGQLALCRLHFEMLKATKTTLERLGMHAVGDFTSPEIDVCSDEWRTTRYQRWRQIKETVKPWKDISPGTWGTELLLPLRYPRCGPEISPFPPVEHGLMR